MYSMRRAPALALILAAAATWMAAAPALAQAQSQGQGRTQAQPQAQPQARPVKPAAATAPAAVPPDVRARIVSKMQGAKPEDVSVSPIPGLYEVTMGGLIAYVTADGKYLVSGNVYDLDTQVNLTATRRNAARAKALAAVPDKEMIVFSPANPKMTVTVFTDVDCGFCRRFHTQMPALNKAGIQVRYLMFPRSGPGTESWRKAEAVWCAPDRRDALTRAKRQEAVKAGKCAATEAIKAQYTLGEDLGVEGTPAVFTQTGDYIGGFLTPEQIVQAVQETQKAATAGAVR
jgi:thiol:disulfide interchange protein DsbC